MAEADGAHFAVAPCDGAFDDAQIPSAGQVEDLRVKGETVHSLSCEENLRSIIPERFESALCIGY